MHRWPRNSPYRGNDPAGKNWSEERERKRRDRNSSQRLEAGASALRETSLAVSGNIPLGCLLLGELALRSGLSTPFPAVANGETKVVLSKSAIAQIRDGCFGLGEIGEYHQIRWPIHLSILSPCSVANSRGAGIEGPPPESGGFGCPN